MAMASGFGLCFVFCVLCFVRLHVTCDLCEMYNIHDARALVRVPCACAYAYGVLL